MGRTGDILASLFFLVVGIGVILGSLQLPLGTALEPMPGFFPLLAGILLSGVSIVQLIQSLLNSSPQKRYFGNLQRPTYLIMGLIAFCIILNYAGYIVSTVFLSAVILWVMGTRTWWKLVVVTISLSLVTYFLFDRVLGLPLPPGLLIKIMS